MLCLLFPNWIANYTRDYTTGKETGFAFIFGVLFSSLTGIMAGANMSGKRIFLNVDWKLKNKLKQRIQIKGELKKPARSIPVGTMSAVIFVFVLYFTENLLLAASCDQ